MCEPVSITMAVLSAAGAGVGVAQQKQQVEDAKRRRALGFTALGQQKGQLDLRSLQEATLAAQEREAVRSDALRAMGTTVAGMASQMGGGASYEAVIQALEAQSSKDIAAIDQNLAWTQQSIEQQKAGLDLEWQMQPTIFEQSDLAAALSIATAGVEGYATGESIV